MLSPIAHGVGNALNHLNNAGCIIKQTEEKGRGVYASRTIQRHTIVEISPVLLFSKEEYDLYGKYTILDQYTFKWTDGRLALALGLGSLFNHSETPNISYTLDPSTDSIRYVTVRDVEPDEELCIFYGHNLWFDPAESLGHIGPITMAREEAEDEWGGLLAVDEVTRSTGRYAPFLNGDPNEILPDEQLPFVRFKLPPEEEDLESIRIVQAWVVDIPDHRLITDMLKWLKQTGLETPDLSHLKRIRKENGVATLLLTTSVVAPILPEAFGLPEPYTLFVPISVALTPISLNLKSSFWPTVYAPPRKGEAEDWSRGKSHWAWEVVQRLLEAADDAKSCGELPIVAHIAPPYERNDEGHTPVTFTACDTRKSSSHPLRHAVINVIRCMTDHRAAVDAPSSQNPTEVPLFSSTPTDSEELQNGTNYLLTSLTLFTTHEPCIMCSMALIHSRVKEVIYLYPMTETGGCGGVVCLPTLKGVNHRFGIYRWKLLDDMSKDRHGVNAAIDA